MPSTIDPEDQERAVQWFETAGTSEYQRVAALCQLAHVSGPSILIETDPSKLVEIIGDQPYD